MQVHFEINTTWLNPLIKWTKARALERSTYEGVIGFSTIILSSFYPAYYKDILSVGCSIWSLLRIITKDATSSLGKALEVATEAHDELIKSNVVLNANPSE